MQDSIFPVGWTINDGKNVYRFDLKVSYTTQNSIIRWIELEGYEDVASFHSPWDGQEHTLLYLLISDPAAAAFFKLTWCK